MSQGLQGLLDFINKDYPTLVTVLIGLFTFFFGSGIAVSLGKFIYNECKKIHEPTESNVFKVLDNPDTLLEDIYCDNKNISDVFADHKLKYISRLSDRNIHEELKISLQKNKYILVKGKSGIGKTREAAEVALELMKTEKYVVVHIHKGWLDVPRNGLEELKNRKFILLFLDDLNDLFGEGSIDPPPSNENISLFGFDSFHNRLSRTITWFSKITPLLYVLATASDEFENWRKIGFNSNDQLWSRFTVFPLPPPSIKAQAYFLESEANRGGVPVANDECRKMARANDGTYRNLTINLRYAQQEKKKLTSEKFLPFQNMSWKAKYEQLIKLEPNSQYLYKSMYLLKQAGIDLDTIVVNKFANRLKGNLFPINLYRHTEILERIADPEKWLRPSEGEIEAANFTEKCDEFIYDIQKVLSSWLSTTPDRATASLFRFTSKLIEKGHLNEAKQLMTLAIRQLPDNEIPYTTLGIIFDKLGNKAKSVANFKKAQIIRQEIASNIAQTSKENQKERKNWGMVQADLYRASSINPKDANIHEQAAILLKALGSSKEAEEEFGISIKLKPDMPSAYYNLALLLNGLNRSDEAIPLFVRSIELDPDNADACYILGQIYRNKGNLKSAEFYFDKRLALLPKDDIESKIDFASINKELGNIEIAIQYANLALKCIWDNNAYSMARAFSVLGTTNDALDALSEAVKEPEFEIARARNNPDFQWIKDDPRFEKILNPLG